MIETKECPKCFESMAINQPYCSYCKTLNDDYLGNWTVGQKEIPMWKELNLSPADYYCAKCIRKNWTPRGCRVTPWANDCAICRLN